VLEVEGIVTQLARVDPRLFGVGQPLRHDEIIAWLLVECEYLRGNVLMV
jgi:hypothetical protein